MDRLVRFSVFLPTIKHNVESYKPFPLSIVIAPLLPFFLSPFSAPFIYWCDFIPYHSSCLMPPSHKLASISYKSEGKNTKWEALERRNRDLSFQHRGRKKKTERCGNQQSHTRCVVNESQGGLWSARQPLLSVFAALVPASFLNSNYRLMGVFSLLGCCSCGWFTVIRPRGTHRLMLPITHWQDGKGKRGKTRGREEGSGKEMAG